MRILYVALTRAKEKLIITGMQKDYEKQAQKRLQQIERYQKQNQKINPILIKKSFKYIDWILFVYGYEQEKMKTLTTLKTYTKKEVMNFCETVEIDEIDIIEKLETEKVKEREIQEVANQLKDTYAYERSTQIPTSSSVTKIKQQEQETVEISFPAPKFIQKEEDIELTAAQKGILLHLCMKKLDENKEYDLIAIKELIHSLVEKELITPKEAQNINPMVILQFMQSNIWQEMKQAKEVQKEKTFYMTIPAEEIYNEEIPEDILLQGMIDLYYINQKDELILVDYKTDFVHSERELIEKYTKQLEYYRKALEEALEKKVERVFLYSTFLGKEIEILK